MRFSFLNLAKQALSAHRNWPEQWRFPEPKAAYDAIIVGAGLFIFLRERTLARRESFSEPPP